MLLFKISDPSVNRSVDQKSPKVSWIRWMGYEVNHLIAHILTLIALFNDF